MARVTIVGYDAAGAVLYAEHCNDMDACDIQEEIRRDPDVIRVECLEDSKANVEVAFAFDV
jgi:hypothetical protein